MVPNNYNETASQVNRRSAEAASLRLFFQEQWETLQSLASHWGERRRQKSEWRQQVDRASDGLVEGTDRRIKGLGGYRQKLRDASARCLQHIEKVVEQLADPIDISQAALQEKGPGRMLLGSTLKLPELLAEDPELVTNLSRLLQDESSDRLYLLFVSGYREKQIFASELQGDLLVSDVLKTTAGFPGRRLLLPCNSEAAMRRSIKRYLFDRLVEQLKLDIAQAQHREGARQADTVDLKSPMHYLAYLVSLLTSPEQVLRSEHHWLCLDPLGFKVEASQGQPALQLHSLGIGEGERRVMMMLQLPKQELTGLLQQVPAGSL